MTVEEWFASLAKESIPLKELLKKCWDVAQDQERELCAKVCEDIDTEYEGEDVLATWCAAAIRAKSNHG